MQYFIVRYSINQLSNNPVSSFLQKNIVYENSKSVFMDFSNIFVAHPSRGLKHLLMLNTFLLPTDAHNVKNVELLKHSKISKNAPTCFGLQGNHLQGAKVTAWLKVTRFLNKLVILCIENQLKNSIPANKHNMSATFKQK